jgi:hypothetical protein
MSDIKLVLSKNPENISNDDLIHIKNEISDKNPNIIMCSEPFIKTQFLIDLIESIDYKIIFLDFDLLYSGYTISSMIKENDRTEVYRPSKETWKETLTDVVKKISNEKFFIIIDSLNGLYNLFEKSETGRLINASLMLLASIGNETKSSVLVTVLARRNENMDWILSPGGRNIIHLRKSQIYTLNRRAESLILNKLDQDGKSKKEFKITIKI